MKLRAFTYFLFFSILSFQSISQTWQHLGLDSEEVQTIVINKNNPNVIYAGSVSDFSTGKTGSLFKTINGGVSWDTLLKGLNITDIDIHPTEPNIVFVNSGVNSLNPSLILKTTNEGQTWIRSDSGISIYPWSGPYKLEFNYAHPETLYAGTAGDDGGALYTSVNGGLFWEKMPPLNYFIDGVNTVACSPINENNLFVNVGGSAKLYYSSNSGEEWIDKGSINEIINVIRFRPNGRIYIGTSALEGHIVGLFFSDDTFKTWINFNPGFTSTTHVRQMYFTGDTIYIRGTDDLYRIFGDSVVEKLNIEDNKCRDVAIYGNNIFIGTDNGVFRRDIITIIKQKEKIMPTQEKLYQNYPNPFNANTIIKFSLSQNWYTTVEIFDVLGRKIQTLFKKQAFSGIYSLSLDNTSFKNSASGIYFYTLTLNGKIVSTKKLLYVK